MRREDIDKFGFELFEFVFTTLDEYFLDHEMTAQEAGHIAGDLTRAFRSALEEHFGVPEPTHAQWNELWARQGDPT